MKPLPTDKLLAELSATTADAWLAMWLLEGLFEELIASGMMEKVTVANIIARRLLALRGQDQSLSTLLPETNAKMVERLEQLCRDLL